MEWSCPFSVMGIFPAWPVPSLLSEVTACSVQKRCTESALTDWLPHTTEQGAHIWPREGTARVEREGMHYVSDKQHMRAPTACVLVVVGYFGGSGWASPPRTHALCSPLPWGCTRGLASTSSAPLKGCCAGVKAQPSERLAAPASVLSEPRAAALWDAHYPALTDHVGGRGEGAEATEPREPPNGEEQGPQTYGPQTEPSELRHPPQEWRAHLEWSCYDAIWIPNPQNCEKTKFCLKPLSLGVIYKVAVDSWKKCIFYQCKNLILLPCAAFWSGWEEKPYSWSHRATTLARGGGGALQAPGGQFSAAGPFLPVSLTNTRQKHSWSLLRFDVTISLCGVSVSHWHKGEMKWKEKNSVHYCSRAKNKISNL